jgi:diacylglycerol kinase
MSAPEKRSWSKKFGDAFRGIADGVRGQTSFAVHLGFAAAVLAAAAFWRLKLEQWCILLLCITVVLTAEMFNSAIEWLARAVDREHNPEVGIALDIASGAVLIAAIGAAFVGLLVFVPEMLMR